jgi:hypothetical protein
MSSQTTAISRQCRLKEWAEMVRECKSRPIGMTVDEWCEANSISKSNYYYRVTEVRKACLEAMPTKSATPAIVPVPLEHMACGSGDPSVPGMPPSAVTLNANGISLNVTEQTSMELLTKVLEVIVHVK